MQESKYQQLSYDTLELLGKAGYKYIVIYPRALNVGDVCPDEMGTDETEPTQCEVVPFKDYPNKVSSAYIMVNLANTRLMDRIVNGQSNYWFKKVYLELSAMTSDELEFEFIAMSHVVLDTLIRKGFRYLAVGAVIPRNHLLRRYDYTEMGAIERECVPLVSKPRAIGLYNGVFKMDLKELTDRFGENVDFMINSIFLFA